MERRLTRGKLSFNDDKIVEGKSPGTTRGLNIRTAMYLGGINREDFTVAPGVGVDNGFSGCITDVKVGKMKVDLFKAVVDSSNVDECTESPCAKNPCLNGGTCSDQKNGEFSCDCPKLFG